jgi:glycosyltransferase involved in cell wall biosynthesis
MAMPRILMFCGQFRPLIGGAERQAEKLARTLMGMGCRVEVLTPRLREEWSAKENISGLVVHRFPYRNISQYLPGIRGLGVPNTLYTAYQTRRAVWQHISEFDVLHAHIASPMVAYAMEAAQIKGKKAICKVACGGPGFDFVAVKRTSLLGPHIVRNLVSHMDRWIAISNQVRMDLMEASVAEHRITCIPNGVELQPESVKAESRGIARKFLYLGRFTNNPRRDFRTLLLAFDALARNHPECELRLVGGGEREQEIREMLATLVFAKEKTMIVGFSDPESWLQWADVLIQPSYSEGMSNTLLEAMTHGLACIANDIPPNREVLEEGRAGILVPVESVDALSAAMMRLASVAGECDRLGNLARTRVENIYSMTKVAERYLNLYFELTAAHA